MRFVPPRSEAGLHTGDSCQMVESIAFFEAYRPVLEGLKTILPGEFPFQVIYYWKPLHFMPKMLAKNVSTADGVYSV